jgi:hypothetical protein
MPDAGRASTVVVYKRGGGLETPRGRTIVGQSGASDPDVLADTVVDRDCG